MPEEDTGTDLSKVQSQMDTEQMDDAQRMPEMQDTFMGDSPYEEVTEANYRVMMKDFGAMENEILFVEYYSTYQTALSTFYSLSDDTEFIKHHDRAMVVVDLEKSHRGTSTIFWELIKRNVVYDDGQ